MHPAADAIRRTVSSQRRRWFGTRQPGIPLALFRIAFGILSLLLSLHIFPLAERLYSDAGVLPRALLSANLPYQTPSLLLLSGNPAFVQVVIAIWAVAALALTLGIGTRFAQVVNYIALVSVLHRNPFFISGADVVFKAVAFWTLFLPLGARWSLDARRRRNPPAPMYLFPLRIAQLQIGLVYLFAGAFKLPSPFWLRGDALFHALQKTQFVSPLGDWFLAHAPLLLLRILTWLTLGWELIFILFLFVPFWQPWARRIVLLTGAGFHLATFLLMNTNGFATIMLATYPLLLAGWGEQTETAGQTDLPIPGRRQSFLRPAQTVLLTVAMLAVLWVNLRSLIPRWIPAVAPPARILLVGTGLTQVWKMFEMRGAAVLDHTLVTIGSDSQGNQYELLSERPLDDTPNSWRAGTGVRYLALNEDLGALAWAREGWTAYFCRQHMAGDTFPESVEVRLRIYRTASPGNHPLGNPLQEEIGYGPVACP